MANEIDMRLPHEKAYEDYLKANLGGPPKDIREMFVLGYMFGKRDTENVITERFGKFVRGYKTDPY
jgi:hypothetical protein